MQLALTANDIAAITESKSSRGATAEKIRGIAGLAEAESGDLSFLGNMKYKHEVAGTRASVVLLPKEFPAEPQPGQVFLYVDSPSMGLARVCARIEQSLWPKPAPGVHPSAVIAAGVKIPASATIGPLCVIEEGVVIGERAHVQAQAFLGPYVTIGEDCWLGPGVVIQTECRIGKRVRLHPGVVVGADGFGYEFAKGRWEKLPQVGTVVIGDDVEIGANSTFDRARFSRTVIGEGTKIDNLVQVGHNVIIGRHCMICAQTGISGSAKLEDFVVLGGQVGVAGHLTIGKGVQAGGQAGINGDVEPGTKINGTPAIPYNLERRIAVLQKRIPDLFKRVDALEAQIRDAK
jgi:UDP-3-O-[3-hydroxymyristoyl] glucosamine N-acyltransferase